MEPQDEVMVALVEDDGGQAHVLLQINETATVLDLDEAAEVFDRLGDMLESCGYFNDLEEGEERPCVKH